MYVSLPKANRSAFTGADFWDMSDKHQYLDGLEMDVAALNKQALDRLLLLSIDLAIFVLFESQEDFIQAIWKSDFLMYLRRSSSMHSWEIVHWINIKYGST